MKKFEIRDVMMTERSIHIEAASEEIARRMYEEGEFGPVSYVEHLEPALKSIKEVS